MITIISSHIDQQAHTDSGGNQNIYYSVDVWYFRQNETKKVVSTDWITEKDGILMTESDIFVDYADEYFLQDFPIHEIKTLQDLSDVDHFTDQELNRLYTLMCSRLASVFPDNVKDIAALYNNSLDRNIIK